MLRAAISLAFFGMLRCSEYTCPSPSSFNPEIHLAATDFKVTNSRAMILVRIKASKTDPFRAGATIRIGSAENELNPVAAIIQYISVRGYQPGPFFRYADNRFLTRSDIIRLLRASLPSTNHINTHSFRVGGASALASIGTPDSIIQTMGRWRSDAFRRYIHLSDEYIGQVHNRAATTNTNARTWNTDLACAETCTGPNT